MFIDGSGSERQLAGAFRLLGTALVLGLLATVLVGAAVASAAVPGSAFNWTRESPADSPTPRAGVAMAEDPADGGTLLFGGFEEGLTVGPIQVLGETWLWAGGNWKQLTPAQAPSPRGKVAMTYDPATREVVAFGGFGPNEEVLGETWSWDGTSWTRRAPLVSPDPRYEAQMAYDPASEEVVLYGGVGAARQFLTDTWSWDGTDWTPRPEGTSLPPSDEGAMATDRARGDVVLFGGLRGNPTDETWLWDGATWTQATPETSPPPRIVAAAAYDSLSEEVVTVAGISLAPGGVQDTWSWDGATWTHRPSPTVPQSYIPSMASDPATGDLVMFGLNREDLSGDTWTYAPLPPPSISISSPADGRTYHRGEAVTVAYECADGAEAPGLESCEAPAGPADGARLDTSSTGTHTFTVAARSKDGLTSAKSVTYTVDEPRPEAPAGSGASAGSGDSGHQGATPAPPRPELAVNIYHRPHRGHQGLGDGHPRYSFRFFDAAPGVTYYCRLDAKPYAPCGSPQVYRHLKRGRHTFRVKSVDAAGDTSPVRTVKFRVGR